MRISGTEPGDYYMITVIPNYSRVFSLIMHHFVGFFNVYLKILGKFAGDHNKRDSLSRSDSTYRQLGWSYFVVGSVFNFISSQSCIVGEL